MPKRIKSACTLAYTAFLIAREGVLQALDVLGAFFLNAFIALFINIFLLMLTFINIFSLCIYIKG